MKMRAGYLQTWMSHSLALTNNDVGWQRTTKSQLFYLEKLADVISIPLLFSFSFDCFKRLYILNQHQFEKVWQMCLKTAVLVTLMWYSRHNYEKKIWRDHIRSNYRFDPFFETFLTLDECEWADEFIRKNRRCFLLCVLI